MRFRDFVHSLMSVIYSSLSFNAHLSLLVALKLFFFFILSSVYRSDLAWIKSLPRYKQTLRWDNGLLNSYGMTT